MKDKKNKPKYNMAQNTLYLVKLVWKANEKRVLFLSIALSLSAVALNLINLYVSPCILGVIERGESVSTLIWTIVVFTAGLMATSSLSTYLEMNVLPLACRSELIAMIFKKSTSTSYSNLIDDKFKKMRALCWNYTDSNSSSTEDIWRTFSSLLTNIIGFVFYLFLMTAFNPILLCVVLGTTILGYFVSLWANNWCYNHKDDIADAGKQMLYVNRKTRDVSFAKDIRIFGLQSWLEDIYDKAMNIYILNCAKAESKVLYSSIVDLVLSFLRNGCAYVYLIYLVINRGLSISEFLLYFTAVGGFTTWVTGILSEFNKLNKQSSEVSTVREFLDYPEQFRYEEGEKLVVEKKGYEIKLENVSYRYPNSEKYTLKDINLTLNPGEKLAIVGLNGAGKTTLVKLICGFLDPTEGRVLLDGVDIKRYNRNDYYNLFSAVFQNFTVIPGSIKTNIVQSATQINMDRVVDCVQKAGLKEKIESLKDGYDTYLNRAVYRDAIMLSGGETQRLMLARSLYKDAPIIVLDEPTAALDPIAESDMYQKYNEMTNSKSSLYISHRLASTRFCDRIILVGNNSILEEGTHEELLAAKGEYAHLFDVQKKYYENGESDDEER